MQVTPVRAPTATRPVRATNPWALLTEADTGAPADPGSRIRLPVPTPIPLPVP